MLMFVQVKYQLRSRGRSVLVLCIAALLAACMAFYVGNIGVNKAALQSLSDSVPVTVRITSRNGAKTAGLNIEAKPFDHLTEAGVHDVRCTAVAAGRVGDDRRDDLQQFVRHFGHYSRHTDCSGSIHGDAPRDNEPPCGARAFKR